MLDIPVLAIRLSCGKWGWMKSVFGRDSAIQFSRYYSFEERRRNEYQLDDLIARSPKPIFYKKRKYIF